MATAAEGKSREKNASTERKEEDEVREECEWAKERGAVPYL
jgi:hypothetical protein